MKFIVGFILAVVLGIAAGFGKTYIMEYFWLYIVLAYVMGMVLGFIFGPIMARVGLEEDEPLIFILIGIIGITFVGTDVYYGYYEGKKETTTIVAKGLEKEQTAVKNNAESELKYYYDKVKELIKKINHPKTNSAEPMIEQYYNEGKREDFFDVTIKIGKAVKDDYITQYGEMHKTYAIGYKENIKNNNYEKIAELEYEFYQKMGELTGEETVNEYDFAQIKRILSIHPSTHYDSKMKELTGYYGIIGYTKLEMQMRGFISFKGKNINSGLIGGIIVTLLDLAALIVGIFKISYGMIADYIPRSKNRKKKTQENNQEGPKDQGNGDGVAIDEGKSSLETNIQSSNSDDGEIKIKGLDDVGSEKSNFDIKEKEQEDTKENDGDPTEDDLVINFKM